MTLHRAGLALVILLLAAPSVVFAGHRHGYYNFAEKYARIAVRQQRENLRLGCHYRSHRWHSNYRDHYYWASRTSHYKAKREVDRRHRALQECRARYHSGYYGYDDHDDDDYGHRRYRDRDDDRRHRRRSGHRYDDFPSYYAETAVRQAKANIRNHCGYQGNRWTTDYYAHYNYAAKTRRYRAESEIQVREKHLNQCRHRSRGYDD